MKKKLLLICIIGLFCSLSVNADELSDWAKEDYENLSKGGILTYDVAAANYREAITRREVSGVLVNLYEKISSVEIPYTEHSFDDTDDEGVKKAYAAGIISGKSENIFDPDGAVTRQEFAKMVHNTLKSANVKYISENFSAEDILDKFADKNSVADWAKESVAAALDSGIINGTSKDKISPKGSATREQAICMISRVYNKYAAKKTSYTMPKFSKETYESSGDIELTWDKIKGAVKYMVVVKDTNSEIMESFETGTPRATIYRDGYDDGEYIVTIGVENSEGIQAYSMPKKIKFTKMSYLPSENFTVDLNEKEARVFPLGRPFAGAQEAEEYMVSVTVPVWKIGNNGEKYAATAGVKVNSALADDVVSIFTEIYNSPEQFPIKSVGGYYWRNTASGRLSQHSYGTCIDINPDENYYVQPDGTPIVGSFWKPYENPYSIPEDGIVVKTFRKYGWDWGGNCWSDKYAKDYMHFTYLGK